MAPSFPEGLFCSTFVIMYTLKKSLGQHFLKDEIIIAKIIEVLEQQHFTNLLEVGPGAGALTRHIMKLPGIDFKAVELDTEKVDYLFHRLKINSRQFHYMPG